MTVWRVHYANVVAVHRLVNVTHTHNLPMWMKNEHLLCEIDANDLCLVFALKNIGINFLNQNNQNYVEALRLNIE